MISVKVFNPDEYDIWAWGNPYSSGNITALHTVQEWAKITGADWCYNEAFFNFVSAVNLREGCAGRTLQYLRNPSIGDIGYGDRTPRIEVQGSIITGWAVAVKDGKVRPGLNKILRRARNMDGVTADGRYIHVTTDRQTEYFVAGYVNTVIQKQYGTKIRYLFVQDSGGSASEYSGISKLAYYPEGSRAVASVICIKRKTGYPFSRTLHRGCRGEDVRMLQMALGGIECDGIFGAGTTARLKKAQKALGLQADGYAGPKTYKAMGYNGLT